MLGKSDQPITWAEEQGAELPIQRGGLERPVEGEKRKRGKRCGETMCMDQKVLPYNLDERAAMRTRMGPGQARARLGLQIKDCVARE